MDLHRQPEPVELYAERNHHQRVPVRVLVVWSLGVRGEAHCGGLRHVRDLHDAVDGTSQCTGDAVQVVTYLNLALLSLLTTDPGVLFFNFFLCPFAIGRSKVL